LMFARADLLAFQNQDDDALKTLDSISTNYTGHALGDDILMKKASIALKKKQFENAQKFYEQVSEKFGTDILADDALFKLAELFDYKLNNQTKAMELYQKLLTDFPGSLYVVDARKRYRKLRGDRVN
jgi:TolA-binding protein